MASEIIVEFPSPLTDKEKKMIYGYKGEVVRCKDCKYNQLPPTSGNADCELWYGMTDVYGYCHYGERREDEID